MVSLPMPGVNTRDFVLATVQGNVAVSVRSAKAKKGLITIWLTSPATIDTTVAYFVLSSS
jgi:hypothetical protein